MKGSTVVCLLLAISPIMTTGCFTGMVICWVFFASEPRQANIGSLISLPVTDTPIVFQVPRAAINGGGVQQSLHLVHNVKSYEIELAMPGFMGYEIFHVTSKGDSKSQKLSLKDEFSFLVDGSNIHVSCPAGPTNITTTLDLEPECNFTESPFGALAPLSSLNGGYDVVSLGKASIGGDVTFNLSYLSVTSDSDDVQLFLASEGGTKWVLLLALGIVFTILWVIFLVLFCGSCCMMCLIGAAGGTESC